MDTASPFRPRSAVPGVLTRTQAYERMAFVRRFEERVLELSREGLVSGSVHLCAGQEAIPVGALAALSAGDLVLATYRGHGWALACGSDPAAVLGEVAQRAGGTNGGRAGSPMLSDPGVGFLGENSIVGAGVPIGAGVALAARSRGQDAVAVVSIGDGAMNQGSVTEGLIFAASRNLPLIVVCEDNGWSEMTPTAQVTRGGLERRGDGLGVRTLTVDGGDPFAVREAVATAAAACRLGDGPVLLVCATVRLWGHYNRDVEHYRPKDDAAAAAAADPVARLRRTIVEEGRTGVSGADLDDLDRRVLAAVDAATEEVRRMPPPDAATALDHVHGAPVDVPHTLDPAAAPVATTYQRALNQALRDELSERPDLLVYGEDVGRAGGIFGVTRGLQRDFGDDRVFDTPIAESAILGSAVGAGLVGTRVVAEVMWADFLLVALDQLVNQAANVRYVNRSALSAPMTVRVQQGVTPGSCAQHSQSLEAVLAHVPGLKVGLPATVQDAYDMLRAAVADPDPTVVVEHRSIYQFSGPLVAGGRRQRAEGARRVREGSDVAVITWGAMVHEALAAAAELAHTGVEALVLDLRWLRPLDDDALAAAVADGGGRVLVAAEATTSGGFGAEVAARVSERHWDRLRSPVKRVGAPDVRMPSAPVLQGAVLPSRDRIAQAARDLLA
jgi:2-oxoisovalerate dehydrogenase E1 component